MTNPSIDADDRRRAEVLLSGENRLLGMVATGSPLQETLTALCLLIEELSTGSLCGVLLVDATGTRVEYGAGPSLPTAYNQAIHGLTVTPSVGPCGLAVNRKEQVIVADLVSDARWGKEWRALALSHGLRACWSTPIMSSVGAVLGTFAVYWREPHSPAEQDQKIVAQITHIAAVAIERKRAEEGVRRGDAYLAEAQRLSRTGSFGWNVATGQIIWSAETFCIMGYEPNLKPALDLVFRRVHPNDVDLVQHAIDRATREGTAFDFEHRLLMPDETIKHVHVVARPSRTASGFIEFVGAIMDVTEKKKAEDATRAAKARFEGIVEIADDAIISIDSGQRIVLFNQGAEKVFGYASAEVIGQSLDLLLPQRFVGAHRNHVGEFSKSPDVSRTMGQRREVFGRRKDGSEFPAEASISKLDLNGEMFFTVILRDVTERKRAAEALRASEQLARGQVEALKRTLDALATESDPDRLLEHILCTITEQFEAHSSSVWRRDESSGRIVFDSAFEEGRLVPKTDEQFTNLDLWLPMEDSRPWTEVFRTGKASVIEDIRTGVPFPLRDRLLPLGVITLLLVPMFVGGRLVGAIGIRFTRKRTFRAEEIELAQALANQAMLAIQLASLYAQNRQTAVIAERNRMARDIHDTLAQGFTGVIMQLEAAKGAAAQRDIAEIANRIERASELARTSLGEARRSVRALRPRSLRDGSLFLAIDTLLKRMTQGTDLNADFQVEGDARSIPADYEEGLLRITQEALTNAVKHANARNFKATLNVSAENIQLRLVDDGRGFDTAAEHEGFGLVGMKERVERMNGSFTVRAKPGVGAEILVELKNHDAKTEHRNVQSQT